MKYFDFLGGFEGSVVPQCHPQNANQPHLRRVINYSSAIEDLRYVLQLVGEDPKGFSEHSMKRGGATEAAKRGATVGEIQAVGHWTNSQTVEKYIEDSQVMAREFNRYFL